LENSPIFLTLFLDLDCSVTLLAASQVLALQAGRVLEQPSTIIAFKSSSRFTFILTKIRLFSNLSKIDSKNWHFMNQNAA
jgi:hypothetical protein